MKLIALTATAVLLYGVSTYAQCGSERVQVKTTADQFNMDADTPKIDYTAVRSTVAELNALPIPEGLGPHVETRFPAELKIYIVDAYLLGFKIELGSKKDPGDHDFHIVIADLQTPDTMISEMPNGPCMPKDFQTQADALRSSWAARFGAPTGTFRYVGQHKIKVEITGIGFFDVKHNNERKCDPGETPTKKNKKTGKMVCEGQEGHAKNNFELHRVIAWKEISAL